MHDGVDFLFLAPLEEELAAILSRVPGYRRLPPDTQDIRIYFQGELPAEFPDGNRGTYRIIVFSPLGMGRVAAATATADAIRRWQPRFVMVVGIAGGDAERVALGDVLVADQFVDYSLAKETDAGTQTRFQTYRADPRLLNAARHLSGWEPSIKALRPEAGVPQRHIGVVLSGDIVQSKQDSLRSYKQAYSSLLGVEMEAGGVASAAWEAAGKPGVLMVRGVSDFADSQKSSSHTTVWRRYACDVAAAYAVSLITSGFVPLSDIAVPGPTALPGNPPPVAHGAEPRLPGAAAVDEFVENYRAEQRSGALFVGRERELAVLDAWRTEPAELDYLLLVALPGLGKSCLLVRWLEQIAATNTGSTGSRTVFCPISPRFGLDRQEGLVNRMLAALALVQVYPDEPSDDRTSSNRRREVLRERLRLPLSEGKHVLFIIDGIDELIDLDLNPSPFPQQLGRGIRIVLSMREGALEASPTGWRSRFGLERSLQVSILTLPPLSPAEVSLLADRVSTTSQLARAELSAELYRLTQGDPLVLGLYVGLLAELSASGRELSAAAMGTLRPGLDGVFEQWWREQLRHWGPKRPYAEPLTQELLGLLACALGPLALADLEALIPADRLPNEFVLADAIRPLSRFISGGGLRLPYAFSHPRLNEFFRARLRQDECRRFNERLLMYCQDSAARLATHAPGTLELSDYVLRRYGLHLEQAGADAAAFSFLVSEPWRKAWFHRTGDFTDFSADAQRAIWAGEKADLARLSRGDSAAWTGRSLLGALYQASINTVLMRIPSQLLCAAVKKGCWTLPRACDYARANLNPEDRAQALLELAELEDNVQDRDKQLLMEALHAARQIRNRYSRADWIVATFNAMPESLSGIRAEVLREEVPQLRPEDDDLASALLSYLPYLPEPEKIRAALLIQENLHSVLRQEDRIYAIAQAIAHLPTQLASQWENDLLKKIGGVGYYFCQVHTMIPSLFGETAQMEAFAIAQDIKHPGLQAEALSRLAQGPHFPNRLRVTAFRECIAAIATYYQAPENYPEPMLPTKEDAFDVLPASVRETLEVSSRHIANGMGQARIEKVLYNLSVWVPDSLLPELLIVAEKASTPAPDFHQAAHAALLRTRARMANADWSDIFQGVEQIRATERRGILVALAAWLPASLIVSALSLCEEISDGPALTRCLLSLAGTPLSPEILARIRRSMEQSADSSTNLVSLLKAVPKSARAELSGGIVLTDITKHSIIRRARFILELLRLVDIGKHELANSAAATLLECAASMVPGALISAIVDLLPHLEPEHSLFSHLVRAGLDALLKNGNDWGSYSSLNGLGPYLSADQRTELRQYLRGSSVEKRAEGLATLVAQSPDASEERLALATEALSAIEAIPLNQAIDRLDALRVLARCLPARLHKRARRVALSLRWIQPGNKVDISFVLVALAALQTHAPAKDRMGFVHDALRVIKEHRGSLSGQAVVCLLPLISDPDARKNLVERALREVFETEESHFGTADHMRFIQVSELAPWLTDAQRRKLLDELLVRERAFQSYGLDALVPYLNASELVQLREALPELSPFRRRECWKGLAVAMAAEPLPVVHSLFHEILHDLSSGSRDDMLYGMDALTPLLQALGAPANTDAAVNAVLEICHVWP